MPGLIPSELVTGLFDSLNAAGVNYLNIKNISHELPDHLDDGKDIDILVSPSDEQKFCETMAANGYEPITYPYGPANGWVLGYNLPENKFFKKQGITQTFFVDACFMLKCKSLMPKVMVPLNHGFNDGALRDKVWNKELHAFELDEKRLLGYLIVRSVLTKRSFSQGYIGEIEQRRDLLDDPEETALLEQEFFKFTPDLIKMIKDGRYQEIFSAYLGFTGY